MKCYLKTDLAYAAALIDGEGHIGIVKRLSQNNTYCLRIEVANTFKAMPDWLLSKFGGGISKKVKGQTTGVDNRKDSYVWFCSTRTACSFLKLVLPYLIVKKEQAKIALEFQTTILHQTGRRKFLSSGTLAFREDCRLRMKALNKRGI